MEYYEVKTKSAELISIDWKYWAAAESVTLSEAVYLSINVAPPADSSDAESNQEATTRIELARRALNTHISPLWLIRRHNGARESVVNTLVSLRSFGRWLKDADYSLSDGFPDVSNEANRADAKQRQWPWGTHETELLRKLSDVANRFWLRYDPTDATTAPTNQQVIDWLKQHGVAERTAEVMATILRADGLPPGPRK